jgi:hypothetical protein
MSKRLGLAELFESVAAQALTDTDPCPSTPCRALSPFSRLYPIAFFLCSYSFHHMIP